MKEISEAIRKLPQDTLKDISKRLTLKRISIKDILSSITSPVGLDAILSQLSLNELRLLQAVYNSRSGMTFGEIEKDLKIEVPSIAEIAENLSKKLLIYIIKNRQLLSNKLDKVYGIAEISKLINLVDNKVLLEKMNKIFHAIKEQKFNDEMAKQLKDEKTALFLKHIAESGCIITLKDAAEQIQPKILDKTLTALSEEKIITIYHNFQQEFNSFIILNERVAPYFTRLSKTDSLKKGPLVHNRYQAIINMFNAFDIISTYGLFLTKQQDFRKIDMKRISEAMIALKETQGKDISAEESAKLSLFFLNRLKCLKLNRDIASISLSEIHKDLDHPLKLLRKTIKSVKISTPEERFFPPPFDLPPYEYLKSIILLMNELKSSAIGYLKTAVMLKSLITQDKKSVWDFLSQRDREDTAFLSAIKLLCLTGITQISDGRIELSDIGVSMAMSMLKSSVPEYQEKGPKSIYINADFTLIIPVNEISSEALYHLMTHTEIVKADFIIHAAISKSSIVKAHKRGMLIKRFIETLKGHSKNRLPQNLDFLLREWSTQTINIQIAQHILLKSSHAGFIDELFYGNMKEGVIERIAENYAIVKKDFIDDIVKLARKKDAVISIFVDDENA